MKVKKHPWAGISGPKADFLKLVTELARNRSHREVFNDFLDCAFCALRSPFTPEGELRDEIEAKYLKIISSDDRYPKRFPELLGIACDGIDQEIDFFGPLSGELGALNAGLGQFFTPWPLCKMSAEFIIDADIVARCVEKNGFITVDEPAAGSGGMSLAAAERIRDLGYDPGIHLWITATDISLTCVKMAFLQLSLRGVCADIIHGNTLSLERWGRYPTRNRFIFAQHHGDRLRAYLENPDNYLKPAPPAPKPTPAQFDLFGEAAE